VFDPLVIAALVTDRVEPAPTTVTVFPTSALSKFPDASISFL
jgi:hypothetical protein